MQPNWFFALPVPAHTWLDGVLRDLPASCRPFAPEDLHMTVAFLGALAPPRVAAMVAALEQIEAQAFRIQLGQLLALPSPKRPSALSFAVAAGHDEAAAIIAAHRDHLLAAAGAAPDTRPPLPHITIARPSRSSGPEGLREAVAWAQRCPAPAAAIVLERIALYTWSEDRKLRQFRIVAEKALTRSDAFKDRGP